MNTLNHRYRQLLQRIRQYEQDYQRAKDSVALLAVSKTKPLQDIQSLYQLGQRDFAENYLQEALTKISASSETDIHWHFIGPVQSNKTRQVAEHFAWVHSIDRIKTARRLATARPQQLPPLNLCLQLNVSGEVSKSGISIDHYLQLADEVASLKRVRLRGLMGLPQPSEDFQQQRSQCQRLTDCFNALKERGHPVDTLSLGTSHDLEAAIAAGSTMVRIGTDLFGARDK